MARPESHHFPVYKVPPYLLISNPRHPLGWLTQSHFSDKNTEAREGIELAIDCQ